MNLFDIVAPLTIEEAKTDYQKKRERERDIDAGKPVPKQRQSGMTDYQKRRAEQKRQEELGEDAWHAGDNAWSSEQHEMVETKLSVGDPVVVTAPNEFEGKTGEIDEFAPSGKFVIVNLYNHGRHSMHLSDVEYNQYADEEDDLDEDAGPSPVAGAIVRRIMQQRVDLLKQYGPELVGAAVDNVADYVGDVEEIGSSDVSAWVAQVERMLKENPPEAFTESAVNPQFINAQVTKILAGEARRMTNAPMAQLLAPVMQEYNLTLQQIDGMVPGGLRKAAGEYGVMMKEGSWGGSGPAGLLTPYAVYTKQNGQVKRIKTTNKIGKPMNTREAEAYVAAMRKKDPAKWTHDTVWAGPADHDLSEEFEGNVNDTELKNVDPANHSRGEGDFVKNQLHTMKRVITHLDNAIGRGEDLPDWVQSEIAQAVDKIVGVMDYSISSKEQDIEKHTGNNALMKEGDDLTNLTPDEIKGIGMMIKDGHDIPTIIRIFDNKPTAQQITAIATANMQQGVAEVTGDKPFDKMMTTIKQGTGKQKTADRKEQQKQTQQRARDAFGNMFGGGNPADKLKIREQGVAESTDEDVEHLANTFADLYWSGKVGMTSATEKVKMAHKIIQAVEDGRLSVEELKQDIRDLDNKGVAEVYTPAPVKKPRSPNGFNKQGTGWGNKLAQLTRAELNDKNYDQLVKSQQTAKSVKENDPCRKNYKQVGMKDKNGKQVPNCVPVKEMDKSQKGAAGWNIDDYDYSKGKWTQGKPVKAKDAVSDMSKELNRAFNSPEAKKPVKENYWTKLQDERNTKIASLINELKESIK